MEDGKKDCIFCKIARGEAHSKKVYESDNFFGFLDINQIADGKTLLIPKKHYKTLLDVPDNLGSEMLKAIKDISLMLIKQGKAEGFNLIMNNYEIAGQIVPHAHIHILPRKKGDGLKGLYLEEAEEKNRN